ncbi:MAG TPA: hypothetical protein VM802_27350 [Chitinophaga sp.]|uniref:hypothetical protein n=1 Tax=Chitinophaga sp. TaxID=1869181 RepID=UPI002B7FB41E|nr:hypothetical protein [Chitinophaga sp.]HVI48615.1 hypothetical protein [Chitinophaga sp.]
MKVISVAFLYTLLSIRLFAYNYGEHKVIGDIAFLRFIQSLQHTGQLSFIQLMDLKNDTTYNRYYLGALSGVGRNNISYGILNGLSGDHESNPLLLEEQLRYQSSVMERIIDLHEQYIRMGYTAAPDGKLSKVDFSYALKAAVNLSHFYEYRKGFQEQLRHFNKADVKNCENPAMVDHIFNRLGKTNAINMYVTLHAIAIDLAEQSGQQLQNNPALAKQLLFYAILFNGFADHFLEDAFSAGHLVVNRLIFQSLTNNKSLHDFYCANGCTALNRKGEIWYAYGDGQFNNPHHSWQQQTTLPAVRYADFTPEAQRIIQAVNLSLDDLAQAFHRGSTNGFTPFITSIPDQEEQQPIYLLNHIPSLMLVPIPYGSRLNTLFSEPTKITAAMHKANEPLRYRDFVRSRVGNSVVIGLIGASFTDEYLRGPELRINAGNFLRHFVYNRDGGKKGLLDHWIGYTLSYSIANLKSDKGPVRTAAAQQVRAGLKGNFDYWISNRKFIGLYSYVEAGAQFRHGGTDFIFVPSVGLQLSSLLSINTQSMKSWIRIPLQYLLPLKFRYGAVISPHEIPRHFGAVDIDFLL